MKRYSQLTNKKFLGNENYALQYLILHLKTVEPCWLRQIKPNNTDEINR